MQAAEQFEDIQGSSGPHVCATDAVLRIRGAWLLAAPKERVSHRRRAGLLPPLSEAPHAGLNPALACRPAQAPACFWPFVKVEGPNGENLCLWTRAPPMPATCLPTVELEEAARNGGVFVSDRGVSRFTFHLFVLKAGWLFSS